MKAFIVVAALIAIAAADSSPDIVAKLEACQKDTGVSDERIKQVKAHEFTFDDDHAAQCFVMCLSQSLKTTDADNKLSSEALQKKHPEVDADKVNLVRFSGCVSL